MSDMSRAPISDRYNVRGIRSGRQSEHINLPKALLEDVFVFDSKPLLLINHEQADILKSDVR